MQTTPGTPIARSASGARRGRLALLVLVAVSVLSLDVVTKAYVVAHLSDRGPIEVVDGVLRFTLTRNSGAAFGLGAGATVLFTLVAGVVVAVIARTAARLASSSWALALGLLLGGALGNLSDRLLRDPGPLRGRVVDWIQLPHWPVFNLADSAIVVGGVLAVVLSSSGRRVDGGRDGARPGDGGRDGARLVDGGRDGARLVDGGRDGARPVDGGRDGARPVEGGGRDGAGADA